MILGRSLFLSTNKNIKSLNLNVLFKRCFVESKVRIKEVDLSKIPPDSIRNISIIAHVDHGKSTLADRILEHVGAIDKSSDNKQVLDKLRVERERGITVKAQTASIIYSNEEKEYLINLIDTPGHVDFASEVTRSLKACQGVILLVDANQGVQAQTMSNFFAAFSDDKAIIPALNKVDLPQAKPEEVKSQMLKLFEIDPKTVIHASAKMGIGIEEILQRVISDIPPPPVGLKDDKFRCFLQDSWYDRFKGATNLIQVTNGVLSSGMTIASKTTEKSYTIKSLGLLTPDELPVARIYPGQIGYMTCNMRSPKDAVIGDTYFDKSQGSGSDIEPVVDITPSKPMVFAGFYPIDQNEYVKLKSAIEKVCLNDASVSVAPECCASLGQGYRLGFLGILHLEVFSQRLDDEYGAQVVITAPSVPYKVKLRNSEDLDLVLNPSNWPENNIDKYYEPMVRGTILAPSEYLKDCYALMREYRGQELDTEFIDETRIKIDISIPLNEILTDFYNDLKLCTSGFGSFDYTDDGYRETALEKMEILLNGVSINELARICHVSKSETVGRKTCESLKELLARRQFQVAIQAKVGGRIIARETIKAYKKDVTAKCYGGDLTRQRKLLKHQAEGKKKLRESGRIQISKDTLIKLLSK